MRILIESPDTVYAAALRLAIDGHPGGRLAAIAADHAGPADIAVLHVPGGPVDTALVAVDSPVLVLGPDDPAALIAAVEAGAAGFALADAHMSEILEAIEAIGDGRSVVPPTLLGSLLRHLVDRRRTQAVARETLESLSPREREVFDLAASGFAKDDIADRLYISPATARTHLERVYKKLGVHSHAELVAFAARVPDSTNGGSDD